MFDSLAKFLGALTSALPKILQLYRDGKHEDKIVELFESYFILGDLIQTGDELLNLSRGRHRIVFSELTKSELEEHYSIVQAKLSVQLLRLQRIGDIFLSNPTIDLLDCDLKSQLNDAIGGKEKGLYSLGAGLFFNQVFGASKKENENEDEHIKRVTKEKYEFAGSITDELVISVTEQRDIIANLKELRQVYRNLLDQLTVPKEKTLLSSKAKEFSEKYSVLD
ncbi:hypothetical protein [Vibrio lentus]|uniref:hypothetical protein n=1 Tax=Vibrio lentus TaxID=136468 RepID=UPI000C85E626|nr:hypothetical protein [Vibrio lentus]PMH03153.1 hypothetical protein BCU78_09465 [Vibrio lentus]